MTQRILNRVIDPATGDELQLTGEELDDGVVAGDMVLRGNDGSIVEIAQPKDVVFHEGAIANGVGATVDVSGYSKLGIEIIRTSVTTNTITFNKGITLTNLFNHIVSKTSGGSGVIVESTDTATSSTFVHMDVEDLKYVQCPITDLTGEGATVTVKGHLE